MPEPIGEPSGITAAQPTSSSRRARIGSSFVYGSTVKPSSTSSSAASSSAGRVGQQRALVADHLELDPVGLERLARELGGEHGVARGEAAGRVGQQADAGGVEHVDDRAARVRIDRGAARRSRARRRDASIAAASASSERKPPVPSSRRERSSVPAMVSGSADTSVVAIVSLPGSRAGPRRARRRRSSCVSHCVARHDLGVDRHRDAAAGGGQVERVDRRPRPSRRRPARPRCR